MNYGVIMAGGAGTRLWPLSRSDRPKQLLPVVKGKSLLQLSYERLRGILPPQQIFVCTGAAHADAIRKNLPELPHDNLLGEPQGRDTANAVGFPAAVLLKRDKDAVMAVVTADHVIEPIDVFQQALQTAFDVTAEQPGALVTFGIVPTYGHTGLGYIHRGESLKLAKGGTGAFKVKAFKEKPDKPTADRYVESGQYYWNSGMFVWRCDTVLGELATHLPESHKGLAKIADAWDSPNRQQVLDETYPKLPKISIDYAVMEPASQGKGKAHVVVVEMPVQWLDVGSWPALAETLHTDPHNNAVDAPAHIFLDSDDNIVISEVPEHLVTTIGISDMIIVHTKDATLICPKNESQRVKEMVAKVKDKFGNKYQQRMRTLAIDLGTRRVGLALSDEGGRFATPYDVLNVSSADQAIAPIQQLIEEQDVRRVVVGLPLNMDDSMGPAAKKTIAWARDLEKKSNLPVIFVDERLSSFEAEQQLNDRKRAGEKLTRGKRKEQLDALAAAGFLQAFLDGKLNRIDV